MITELHIDDPNRTPVEWWPKIKLFEGKTRFEFQKAGLTVLWGPNGSGKSSLLKVLARLTHCEQGGTPLVTRDSVGCLRGSFGSGPATGARIKTDGKPVHFCDPSATPGLVGGMAGFDWDFGIDGIQGVFAQRSSSGQQTTYKFNRILESAAKITAESKVEWKIRRPDQYEDYDYADEIRQTVKLLEANIDEDGPPTILLDEPGRSLSIPRQAELWNILARQQRFQIIVATHSVFALHVMGAKYIDVQPGYLEESRKELETLSTMASLMQKAEAKRAELSKKEKET
jgi:predicted ATPase